MRRVDYNTVQYQDYARGRALLPVQRAATREGGTLLLRAQFSDHMPRLWWLGHFPGGHELDAAIYEPLAVVQAGLESAGWQATDFAQVYEPPARSRAEVLDQLRLRTWTIFEYLTPEQIEVGFERLEQAVAADPDAPVPPVASTLLTLVRA